MTAFTKEAGESVTFRGYGWDDTTRSHPVVKWFEEYANAYDSGTPPTFEDWFTNDFVYTKSDGTEITGGKAAFDQLITTYQVFPKHFHCPIYMNLTTTPYGWDLNGHAKLYVTLVGEDVPGVQKIKDDYKNEEWDTALSSMFRFEIVKNGDSYLLQRINVFVDTAPVFGMLMARGVKLG